MHIEGPAAGGAESGFAGLGGCPAHILRKSVEIWQENAVFENAQIEVPVGGGD